MTTIKISKEVDYTFLLENCWAGAIDTLNKITEFDKEEELIDYLNEMYGDNAPSIEEINDFLWFNSDSIFEDLDIDDE